MPPPDDRDPFDGLVLDEAFLSGGRREGSADERLEHLARIAFEHERAAGWRQPAVLVVPAPARRRRQSPARRTFARVLVVMALLVGAAWLQGRPAAPERLVLDAAGRDRAVLPTTALPPVAAAPPAATAPPPARLAPLPPDPGGQGGHAFLQTQDDAVTPVAYDPCRTITWVVRRQGEPPGGDALLDEAFAEVSAATGLVFRRGPDTDEPPDGGRDLVHPYRYGPGVAPVLVSWSDERESPDLAGRVAGYAGSASRGFDVPATQRYLSGTVVLDAEYAREVLDRGDGRALLRSTVLHELGHLVGLDHVDDPEQLMHPEGDSDRLTFADGDRRGLRRLGEGRCFTDWDALLAG